ncbi:methylation-associated defense system restriction endonuclease subunit S MAD5 [Streptomyces sp. NPDC002143]
MKIASKDNPVRIGWLREQGLRMDAAPYLSGAFEARKLLERLPVRKEPLGELTEGHNGGIFNGPQFRRVYVLDPDHGVPFLGSRDMLRSDFTDLPLLKKSDAMSGKLSYLQVKPGMTLISCSGFYAGRRAYVRPDMADCWSSQDVLKVEPHPDRIRAGYLYAFLASRFGEALVKGSVYGSAIKHIEPHHITGLPVPRFDPAVEQEIHDLVEEAATLRAEFQTGSVEATEDLFRTAGLEELIDLRWHDDRAEELGFVQRGLTATTLRPLNYQPRAERILRRLREADHVTLGEICRGGQLSRGLRFMRVDGAEDPRYSYRLVGQRQAFWLRPEGRWISKTKTSREVLAKDETILVASQGTLGENEVFCRSMFATGSWLSYAYSEHFLRIRSGDTDIPGAYLFAFFRSEAVFRVLRSLSTGGKQQDIHEGMRAQIPVPVLTAPDRKRIAETIRTAYRKRDEADRKEDKALELLERAVLEHSAAQ